MVTDYGSTILNLASSEKMRKEVEKAQQKAQRANLTAALTGMFAQALTSGGLFPQEGGMNLGALVSPESMQAGFIGGMQPVADSGRDLMAGGLSGMQVAQAAKEKAISEATATTKEQMEIYKLRENVLSNFDLVGEGQGGFLAETAVPGVFPTGTYLKRKAPTPLFGGLDFGATQQVEHPIIKLLKDKGAAPAEIEQVKKDLGIK
uniref:Uncharacterized protein n=1 Tax=viral metagenome TaxID=1070528 RepID=A0A6H1ZC42_9ZZZZ